MEMGKDEKVIKQLPRIKYGAVQMLRYRAEAQTGQGSSRSRSSLLISRAGLGCPYDLFTLREYGQWLAVSTLSERGNGVSKKAR